MLGKIAGLVLGLMLIITVASCEKPVAELDEDRLTHSFRNESPEIQQHVAMIAEEARQLKYKEALNKLALLSATRKLTREQKYAVDTLVRHLRYDMEEKIFSEQETIGVTDE